MKIIIDAMGGDNAPLEIVKGALSARARFGCDIVLSGDEAAIRDAAARCGVSALPQGVTVHPTTETVEIPPLDGSASRAGCRAAALPQEITGIDVINLNGERVATVSDIAELHSLTPGIYVLKVYNESSIVKTIKYAKR